jgi:hypothetical protein
LRVRDGDREIEVSGSPAFIRQVLADLHTIWAQLHGAAPPKHPSIRMPEPPEQKEPLEVLGTDAGRG